MKNYQEALKDIVNIINTTEKSDIGFVNICSYINENCPELMKSKDDRIKENIIATIHLYYGEPLEDEAKEMIAWLEKQGDKDKLIQELGEYKVKYTQEVLGKHLNGISNKDDESLEKQGERKSQRMISAEAKEALFDFKGDIQQEDSTPKTESNFLFKVKYDGKEYNVKNIEGDAVYEAEDQNNVPIYLVSEDCEIIRDGYGIKENGSPYPTKPAVFSEKSHAWSEEDARNLQGIIDEIEANKNDAPDYDLATYDRFLSWFKSLRPQNTEKPQGKTALEVWKEMRLEVYAQASGNRHEPNCSDNNTKMFSLNDIDEIIEKVGCEANCTTTKEWKPRDEQKPVEEVEPKFKVGDWVVRKDGENFCNGCKFAQITNIDDDKRHWLDSDSWLEKEDIRLWTIQDAKDGDVLATDYSVFIFQKVSIDGNPIAHGGLIEGTFYEGRGVCWTEGRCYPATGEQRELLFQKIKKTDYEWDFKNKKLNYLLP